MVKRGIPFIEIEARDNYEFGFKLGRALKKQICYRIEKNKEIYKKKAYNSGNFSILIKKAKKFLPEIKKRFPKLLIEAKAMALGAGVNFDELLVLMCDEEIVDFKVYPLHCTSVAIRTPNNKILVGHNEDWFPEYRKNGLVLVKGKIKNNKFLALTYIGNLVGSACGFNSNGLTYTDNSLVYSRFIYNVPRSFHLRALLDAKKPKDAIKILDNHGSAISSTLLVWSNLEIVDVEELWTHDEIFRDKKWLIHTNHPLARKNRDKENTKKESLIRYKKAKDILSKEKEFDIYTLRKILKNHEAEICCHKKKKHPTSYTTTIASLIMNPKDKWMLVAEGNPCKNKYKKYKL